MSASTQNTAHRRAAVRLHALVSRAKRMFKCDTARITSPCGRHFLVIGWKKNTKTERESGRDAGQWYRNGEPIDFDFVSEQVIANGRTLKALWNNAKHYKRLLTSTTNGADERPAPARED